MKADKKESPSFLKQAMRCYYALIARQVLTRYGEQKGLPALRKAIRRYGEQRGRRMALRARAEGEELSMASYLAYGEWRFVTDGSEMERTEDQEDIRLTVRRCPWEAAWRATGLLPYGRYYCQEVDAALLRGFNPHLRIEVSQLCPTTACRASLSIARRCREAAASKPGKTLASIGRAIRPDRRPASDCPGNTIAGICTRLAAW